MSQLNTTALDTRTNQVNSNLTLAHSPPSFVLQHHNSKQAHVHLLFANRATPAQRTSCANRFGPPENMHLGDPSAV